MKIKQIILTIGIVSILTLTGCTSVKDNIKNLSNKLNEVNLKEFTSDLDGTWKSELSDGTDLSLRIEAENKKVYLTSKREGCSYYELRDAGIKDGKLNFSIPRKSVDIIFDLSLTKDNELVGNSKFYEDVEDISFIKTVDQNLTSKNETSEFSHSYNELQELIKENSQYKDDNMDYKFLYDLENKDGLEDVIKKYKIDESVGNKKDVELMESLLNWECDLLNHSSNNISKKHDLDSLIKDGLKDGTNCRGLSLILSEVLRMYGIKAQAIGCMPYENIFNDCHVVVNAYSEELKKWIMLDPTYGLILKDESGKYVGVQDLRENILNNVKMIRNSNACLNKAGAIGKMSDMEFQDYLNYMAKNSCRYIKTEENYDASDCERDNIKVILVSDNYEKPRDFKEEYKSIITTDSEKFWEN